MNRFFKITIVFLGAVVFVTYAVSIYLSNTKSVESIEAADIQAKVNELSGNNMKLQSEVLSLSSFNAISSRAAELGYNKTLGFVSLYDPIEVARTR